MLFQHKRFYISIFLGVGTMGMVQLTLTSWFPAFLVRVYAQTMQQIGFIFGPVLLISSIIGLLLGPILAQRLEKSGYVDAPLRVTATAGFGMLLFSIALPFAPNAHSAIGCAGLLAFFTSICVPLIGSACQLATPGPMRGLVSSIYSLSVQVISYGAGPTLVAIFSDHLFKDPAMVGYSLQIVCSAASAVTIILMVLACGPFRLILRVLT